MFPPTIDDALSRLRARQPIEARVAVVVAHPDDETIGIGPFLHLFRRLTLIHVTDGAPRDLDDARTAGFGTGAAYAAARRAELQAALRAGGCDPGVADQVPGALPVTDQAASLDLRGLATCLRARLANVDLVFTHAFEGGHPDHDAVAFAVAASGVPAIEMAGYHATPDGAIEVGVFLGSAPAAIPLTPEETQRRDAMLACFETQRTTLVPFTGWTEARFRPAPTYDFTRLPASRAYYDGFRWGMTSDRWRGLAADALADLAMNRART